MITTQINSENPDLHWQFVECSDAVVIDLGCGRWEHVEYRDSSWPTTPEWFLLKGARVVYAYDVSQVEVDWFNSTLAPTKNIKAFQKCILSVEDIKQILQTHKPTVIKCDIEGYESVLLNLSDKEFCSVDFYAIETHTNSLYDNFVKKFQSLNYEIVAIVELLHAVPMKVIFAKKKK